MPSVRNHWKMAVPLPRVEAEKAFGKIERDDHADEACADPLQQAAQKERFVTLRQRDDRDADDKKQAAEDHEWLAADPVRDEAGKKSGDHAAQQHRGHDRRELAWGKVRSRLEIRDRAADDAHVHAVEQAAQSRDQQQKQVVLAVGGAGGRDRGCRTHSGYCHLTESFLRILILFAILTRTVCHLNSKPCLEKADVFLEVKARRTSIQ